MQEEGAQEDVMGAAETGTCLNEREKKALRVMDVTGGHGPWQFRHWAIFFLASFCCSMHLFSTLPLATLPSSSSCQCYNSSENKRSCNISSCDAKRNEMSWSELSEPCFSSTPTTSLEYAEEDNSHCSNVGVVLYAKCLFVVGSIVSTFATFPFMKRYGRRSTSLTSCFLLSSCSLAGIWAFAPAPYLVLKFVLSMGIISVYLIAAFSLTECVTEEFRLLYFYTAHISWGLAHFVLPFLIWVIPSWTLFNVLLTVPCFLLLIILCFLPETAESYASRGLIARAHKVMRNAARCNGFSLQGVEQFSPTLLLHSTKEDEDSWKLKNYRSFLEHVALFFMGFVSSFTYFTIMWLADWLPVKRGSYFALMATTEVAAALVLLLFTHFIPVRRLWAVTSSLSSILLIIMYTKENKAMPTFSKATYIVQMFFASASWTVSLLHVLSQPLVSNKIKCRSLVIGVGICVGLLGAALADIQKLMGWNRILLLVMGVPNLVIGACIGLIPNKYLDSLNV